jgi:hypothetical protein
MTTPKDPYEGAPDAPLSPEELAVQRLLRESPEPEPRAAFRDRLRREFTEGRVQPRTSANPSPFHGAFAFLRLAIPLAAAVVLLTLWMNQAPHWRLVDSRAGTFLRIDGENFDTGDTKPLLRMLRAGARVQTPESLGVTLLSPGHLAIKILPGTDMTLPAPPRRWFGRSTRASIATGEMHVTTDHSFHGARLFVNTPELEVEVVGTTVAIIRPEFGTCICVLDGTVLVAPHDGVKEPVSSGRRFTFFREEGRIDRGDILPMERTKLGEFQSICAPSHSGGHGM